MLKETKQMKVRDKDFHYRKAIVSWHILSVVLFVFTLSVCGAMSNDENADVAQTNGAAISPTKASTSVQNSTTMNETDEHSSSFTAADCFLDVYEVCPENVDCTLLGGECIDCEFNTSCQYGSKQVAKCSPKANITCSGKRVFEREYDCRYCYQLSAWQTWCNQSIDCALNKPRSHWPARPFFVSTCWAKSEHLCMGRRCFHKQVFCNWSNGYKWSKAMLLSIFLGGFGVDRFYLGFWVEGIGKLLSFGGLGVWTLVDVILIGVGYIGPSDGSLYI
ncbi:Tm2 domain-containing protein 3-like [Plakobranchus ocellatus]|uniref:Tm2 domain-containing protein 3-like n=1 Tax=Plakobranchus ocellatus TaxID=259542 RepID=A0AAV4D154_9GAST|nr:Tm2 domain-containing protein 3-like [Plakobranchus ocellatus]